MQMFIDKENWTSMKKLSSYPNGTISFPKMQCHREKTNTAERTNVPLNILIVKQLPPEFMVKFYNISICSKQMFISKLSMNLQM